ncbi:unnamed protein product [Pieris brassicae]|uniref:Uncharacterized protein n=1 Tax=Pieris brassicae TaxID=7116 RepID=A0A9P0SYP1_PIEBR|nr:unnamed protein product [Pieris brassicae]
MCVAIFAIVRVRRKPPRFGSCTQGERGCVAASPLGPVFCGPHGAPSVAHLYVVPPGALRGGKDEPTWPCCFSRYVRVAARLAFAIVNNLYCIPAYVVWMMALRLTRPLYAPLYWRIEGLMYHWLLAMVSLWTWTAGYEKPVALRIDLMLFVYRELRQRTVNDRSLPARNVAPLVKACISSGEFACRRILTFRPQF